MLRIRTVKTSSGATAVQVVEYVQRKTVVISHIGSAGSNAELLHLKQQARNWIVDNGVQMSLFGYMDIDVRNKKNDKGKQDEYATNRKETIVIDWSNFVASGSRLRLLYELLSDVLRIFNFDNLNHHNHIKMLGDMIIARIVSPGSKLYSLQFLSDYFGIKYQYRTLSRALPDFINLKDDIEERVINIAKDHFNFNFNLVFYDLTTLYFESFETDELRRIGFSKDNKASQPQIMIGLLVNESGFPISYQLFPGNKFEGHSLMPSINALRKRHKIKNMTIVADSAMLSDDNIKFLKAEDLNYIVAARTANLPISTIEEIAKQLNSQDEATIRIPTTSKGDLICSFSKKRYDKERREMNKQLEKAQAILKTPSKAEIIKRSKFLRGKKLGYELNQELINKTTMLLGIKGYYSNCNNLTNQEIITHYKNLWNVEKAFRISKSDLKMRPIYHFKETTIKSHILICFMALAIVKFIELKTNKSIKSIINLLKTATDNIILDKRTGEKITLKAEIDGEIKVILDQIEKCRTRMS